MFESHAYAVGTFAAVDQLDLSRAAARASEHQRAVRALKLERTARRKQRRVGQRNQEAYTTAV